MKRTRKKKRKEPPPEEPEAKPEAKSKAKSDEGVLCDIETTVLRMEEVALALEEHAHAKLVFDQRRR